MNISESGLRLLQAHEGLRLTAYPDPGSSNGLPITIGWGATSYEDGSPIGANDTITRARAAELLKHHVQKAVSRVLGMITTSVSQNMFDALVSFEYNTGALARSTLLKRLNEGDFAGAAEEFGKWVHNDGKVMSGLVSRRKAERALFESQVTPAAGPAPTTTAGKIMDPLVIPILTIFSQLLPTLSKLFKGENPSRVAERNMAAVQEIANKVIPVVVASVGAPNAQAAAEAIKADPALAKVADDEIKMSYAELHELSERSFKQARDFNVDAALRGVKPWQMGAMWVTAVTFVLIGYVVFKVMSLPFADGKDLIILTVTAIVGALTTVLGFWLGSSRDSQRKTEFLAREKE